MVLFFFLPSRPDDSTMRVDQQERGATGQELVPPGHGAGGPGHPGALPGGAGCVVSKTLCTIVPFILFYHLPDTFIPTCLVLHLLYLISYVVSYCIFLY